MTVQSTRREMQRMAIELEIKAAARKQLAVAGVQQVTLRGIARDMGMTAPALYRYFPSLDDLVASMCDDFFEEVTEAISQAVAQASDSPGHALHAAIRTFRDWATTHPGEFTLTVGDPADHLAPRRGPRPGSQKFAEVFFGLYVQMWHTQTFPVPALTEASAATCARMADFAEQALRPAGLPDGATTDGADLPPGALFIFARTWVRLYGVITMEVLGQLTFMFDDVTSYFESELEDAAAALGVPYLPRGSTESTESTTSTASTDSTDSTDT